MCFTRDVKRAKSYDVQLFLIQTNYGSRKKARAKETTFALKEIHLQGSNMKLKMTSQKANTLCRIFSLETNNICF